jgi:hypothetical protein
MDSLFCVFFFPVVGGGGMVQILKISDWRLCICFRLYLSILNFYAHLHYLQLHLFPCLCHHTFVLWYSLTINFLCIGCFKVLACIVSTIDDTKLVTKVVSSCDAYYCYSLECLSDWVSIELFWLQAVIRELQSILKELVLDKVSTLLAPWKSFWLHI